MKAIYHLLKTLLWCFIGVFIGSSLYRYYDYKTHPDFYAIQSAPWYLDIEVRAIFTIVIVVILFIILWVLRKKMQ